MNELSDQPNQHRFPWLYSGLFLLLVILFIFVFLGPDQTRQLKPIRPTESVGYLPVSNQPIQTTFAQLNQAPDDFLNQLIRVTGDYTRTPPPTCLPDNGPGSQWALIANDLQMPATGFETVLRKVAPGTTLTVDGIWRKYVGPVVCGKAPPVGFAWYLQVTKIVQPNPLTGSTLGQLTFVPGTPGTRIAAADATESTETATPISTTVSLSPTPSDDETVNTAIPTAVFLTPSSTPTNASPISPANNTPTATATQRLTRTPTAVTPNPQTGSRTPTPTPTITPTATPRGVTIATATPVGYGGPLSTATPYP